MSDGLNERLRLLKRGRTPPGCRAYGVDLDAPVELTPIAPGAVAGRPMTSVPACPRCGWPPRFHPITLDGGKVAREDA